MSLWRVLAVVVVAFGVVFVGSAVIAGMWQGIKEMRRKNGKQDR